MFLGVGLIWCFFFLEETNYKRSTVGVVETIGGTQTPTSALKDEKHTERSLEISDKPVVNVESGTFAYGSNKTYLQRLSVWQTTPGADVFSRAFRSLRYLGWPCVLYAGFSYGSYLV